MLATARDLGLGALVETHSDEDLDKVLATDAEVVGVNARDLETLDVDVDRALDASGPHPRRTDQRDGERDRDARARAGGRGCRRVCHPGGRSADARRRSRCQAPGAAGRGELTMSAVAERTILGPRRPRPVRHLRGTVRARGPDPGPGRARRRVVGAPRRSRVPHGVRRPAPRFRRASHADHACAPAVRGARLRDLAEARGPGAHGRAQDQQRARPGAGREAAGQGADHRGDRRRPARRRRRHGERAARPPVRRVHGRGGHASAGAERREDEAARCGGRAGHGRHPHAEGSRERGAPRLGRQRAQHPLHHRLGRRPASRSRCWCATCSG